MTTADSRLRRGVLAFGTLIGRHGLGEVHGVHVRTLGQPPVEQHWTPDVRRDVFSVSKTFVSVAVGIAAAEGLLMLSDPPLSHLGHLGPVAAQGVELITIEHLLTMTSGIVYQWDDPTTSPGADPAQAIVVEPLGSPDHRHPGRRLLRDRARASVTLPPPVTPPCAAHRDHLPGLNCRP